MRRAPGFSPEPRGAPAGNFRLAPLSEAVIASFPTMRFPLYLALGLAVATAVLHAQSDDDEDSMDYFPLVPTGNTLQFGLRFVGGPKVSFGQLGSISASFSPGAATGVQDRTYNDGAVNADTRQATNGSTNLSYDGLTNNWNYDNSTQVTPDGGGIAFHSYNIDTLGAGFTGKKTSSDGWELQLGHSLGKIGGKVDFSLVGGFSFSSISSKVLGSVPADLVTTTDVYSLYGQPVPTAPYTAPSQASEYVYDANGNPLLNSDGTPQTKTVDNTTLLGVNPTRTTTTTPTQVTGEWQIKGAYYTFRFGPEIRVPLTERLKFSLGAGAAIVYIGTRYVVQESATVDGLSSPLGITAADTHNIWMPAYYANADAEYWLTERTGFYMGATFQQSGSYDQTLYGRTAQIDLGSTYGLTSGFTLRF
jgi:hypothetical protein